MTVCGNYCHRSHPTENASKKNQPWCFWNTWSTKERDCLLVYLTTFHKPNNSLLLIYCIIGWPREELITDRSHWRRIYLNDILQSWVQIYYFSPALWSLLKRLWYLWNLPGDANPQHKSPRADIKLWNKVFAFLNMTFWSLHSRDVGLSSK